MVFRILLALLLVGWVGEWSLERDTVLYSSLWRSPLVIFAPLFDPIPGVQLFPWQVLLIGLVPLCLAVPGAFSQRSRELDIAIIVSLTCIALTFLWGWSRGGSPVHAYHQVWRFMTGLLIAYLLVCVMRTPQDLRALSKVIVWAALIRATLVLYFYAAHIHGRIVPPPEYMTNHDDSLLFVAAVLISGSWAILTGGRRAWLTAGLVCAYMFGAMVLNDRRIAWVELAFALIAMYFLIGPGELRRRVIRLASIALPLALVAFAVVGSDQLQRLLTTGSYSDPSSLGRQEEVRNLLFTMSINGNPLLGTGWGAPYQKLTSAYANYDTAWGLALYTPHNSLLGLAAFAGLVGIIGIFCVVPTAAFVASRGFHRSSDPVIRAGAMVAVGTLVAYAVHCYGDIGFQSYQGGLLLGAALATAGKVAAWSEISVPCSESHAAATESQKRRWRRPVYGKAAVARAKPRKPLSRPEPSAVQHVAARSKIPSPRSPRH